VIDLGQPLHASDACFVRAEAGNLFAALCDPFGYTAFWPDVDVTATSVTTAEGGRADLRVGDRWSLRGLVGAAGCRADVDVTDLREREAERNLWMDWHGELDPVVGLPLPARPFGAESEWHLRPWRDGTVWTWYWRVAADPPRPQQRLLITLRRLGWKAMTGVKRELERA
jgi:hypothetical protein